MDVYQVVTDKIISLLEQGTIPWRKPWNSSSGIPRNLITNKEYRGINLLLLSCQEYSSPYWLTYRQVISKKGNVRKGEKASPVIFYRISSPYKVTGTSGDAHESEPDLSNVALERRAGQKPAYILKCYHLFNLEQCEGVTAPSTRLSPHHFTPIEKAEQIVAGMTSPPEISYGGSVASYSPIYDKIRMPTRDTFENSEQFYSVLFHELSHSVGHHSRLARKEVMERNEFGSQDYSAEELCAELSASMLCAVAGISNETIELSAAYIESWLSAFRSDKRMLVVAAGKAQKAADYILCRNLEAHESD